MTDTGSSGFDFNNSALQARSNKPLAARVRPTSLESYCGQEHILGPDSALRQAMLKGELHSMILWGPPGTGKTTAITTTASHFDCDIYTIPITKELSDYSKRLMADNNFVDDGIAVFYKLQMYVKLKIKTISEKEDEGGVERAAILIYL